MLKLVNESIFKVKLTKSAGVGNLLIDNLFDVSSLYFRNVSTHGNAFVIDLLLVDSGREENVQRWVDYMLRLHTLHRHHL